MNIQSKILLRGRKYLYPVFYHLEKLLHY